MKQSLKLERDRERSRRKSKQGQFEADFVSLDEIAARPDADRLLSDHGAAEERMVAHLDGEPCEREKRLRRARERLRRAHPELVEVFNLIVKNGSNRKESIWQLMKSSQGARGTRQGADTGTH